jgi:hypothetical protein
MIVVVSSSTSGRVAKDTRVRSYSRTFAPSLNKYLSQRQSQASSTTSDDEDLAFKVEVSESLRLLFGVRQLLSDSRLLPGQSSCRSAEASRSSMARPKPATCLLSL